MISDQALLRLLRSRPLVALLGDLIRAIAVVSICGVVSLCLAYYVFLGHRMYAELAMNDFGRFYYSARAFLAGGDMYGPTEATAIQVGSATAHLWNMNPPHFHLLLLPIALLTPLAALNVWWAANLVALSLSLHVVGRQLGWRWTMPRLLWTATAVVLCSATGIIVVTGQLSFLLMLPFTLAWAAARHGRWARAAVWLGVAVSVKPFLGLFWIYLLTTRRWKGVAAMTLSAAACVASGIAVFGWASYAQWFEVLWKVDWAFAPMNASTAGILSRSFTANPIFVSFTHAPSAVSAVSGALAILIGSASLFVFARDRSMAAVDRAFAGLVFTSLLVSPLGWMYYVWLALGPVAAIWTTIDLRQSRVRDACIVAAVPGLLLPLYATTALADLPIGSITLGSTYGWTMCWMWSAVMADSVARPRKTAA